MMTKNILKSSCSLNDQLLIKNNIFRVMTFSNKNFSTSPLVLGLGSFFKVPSIFEEFRTEFINDFLTPELIKSTLTKFFEEVMNPLTNNQKVLVLFRIKFIDENRIEYVRTLGSLLSINKNQFKRLLGILELRLGISDQEYHDTTVKELIINYIITDQDTLAIAPNIYPENEPLKLHRISKYNLPTTMNLKKWGLLLHKSVNDKGDNIFKISRKKGESYNIVETKIISENETKIIREVNILSKKEIVLSVRDELNDFNDMRTFSRFTNKSEFHYVNGEMILKSTHKNTFWLKRLELFQNRKGKPITPQQDNRILTLDMETQLIDNVITPIMVNIFDGSTHFNFFRVDYDSVDEMILLALETLLKQEYNNYKIYVHNFSGFDGIFLMKYFLKLNRNDRAVDVTPTIKDSKIINVDLDFYLDADHNFKISFRDSYLILLFSLAKLAKTFKVTQKGKFTFSLVDNLNLIQLDLFRSSLIYYCQLDCLSLYEVLNKFNNLIFNKWHLSINNYPTLSSLAMGVFRSNFYCKDTISLIKGTPFKDIKESYTGGSTDMIIPHGYNIYGYDVNSLYPSVMANNKVPTDNMIYFEGVKPLSEVFGFVYANIIAPERLNLPILQIHHKGRTISPLGKFSGWFFSEELKMAIDKFGYKATISKGYLFDSKNVFKNYVESLYSLRQTYSKTEPMNYIAKILMNSLYGRFGLKTVLPDTEFIDKNLLSKYIADNVQIDEIIEFDEKLLIQYISENTKNNDNNDSFDSDMKSNIAIASSITAYSRMVMAEFKLYCLNNDIKIYYTDTDSIYTDKPLPDHMVGDKLGQFKLEGIYKEAVFLAPKVYGLIKEDGSEIIKVKGYKNRTDLSFKELKELLILDSSIKLPQEKWYRNMEESKIIIKDQIYTLRVTSNKRLLLHNENGVLIGTKPFIL